jgi:hypothetical protein
MLDDDRKLVIFLMTPPITFAVQNAARLAPEKTEAAK